MEHRAGFWIRFVATLIDSLLIGVVQFIISLILGGMADDNVFSTIINLIITILYFVWYQTKANGQTLGKRITGIRVITIDGGAVSYGQMFIREIIGKLISALILFIGYIMAAGKTKRALHDRIAKTLVVRAE